MVGRREERGRKIEWEIILGVRIEVEGVERKG